MSERKTNGRVAGPTLRDVATAAGVSVWTVSTAYSNPGKVAEATRQRVLDAATALGYPGPHPGARSLARGRTGVVAFVAPGHSEALLADPAAALVARGLLTACHRADRSMLLSGRASGEMVDGRVFFREVAVTDRRVPALVVDGEAGPELVVRADVRGAASALASHLHDLGHRRLAVLAWRGAGERLAGVWDGWGASSPPPEVFVLDDDDARGAAAHGGRSGPTPAAGEVLARAALARRPRPTAVLALSDTLATSVLHVAHWMRLDVPGDLSVAGLDDLPGSDVAGLTSALVPYRALGERAGDLLMARLEGEEPEPVPDLPTALAIRRSTGPPP
jgi:DNA-binding LacI/PurR family transcriptional regulator